MCQIRNGRFLSQIRHIFPDRKSKESSQEPGSKDHFETLQKEKEKYFAENQWISADTKTRKMPEISTRRRVEIRPEFRSINVSIVGYPNAGKSELSNKIVGLDVCAVSRRVHTTRRNSLVVGLNWDCQVCIVFISFFEFLLRNFNMYIHVNDGIECPLE